MSPWAIAGIVVGGVAVVGILYAVSNRESDSLPPPRGNASGEDGSDGWGAADVGRGLNNLLPGLFRGINSLGSGSGSKTLNDSGYRENPETRVNTESEKQSALEFDRLQDSNPTVSR